MEPAFPERLYLGTIGKRRHVSVTRPLVAVGKPSKSEPAPAVDLILFVQKVLEKNIRHVTDFGEIERVVRGMGVHVTHREDKGRQYRISGLTEQPATAVTFQTPSGDSKTVSEYFSEKYKKLDYDVLPCLEVVDIFQKPIYLPMEVCEVPEQGRNATPTPVKARVLPAPTLKYHDDGSEKSCCPKDGQWNFRNKKMIYGASITKWACLNFCNDFTEKHTKEFCLQLADMSRTAGLSFPELGPQIIQSSPNRVANMLWLLRHEKFDLLLVILPDENGNLYGTVKRICETEMGLISQCCLSRNVKDKTCQYLSSVAAKINAKVVACQAWREVNKYTGIFQAQDTRHEIINGLDGMVKNLLCIHK